jgi:hypothetical protein
MLMRAHGNRDMDGNHEVESCFQTCLCQGLEPSRYCEFVRRFGHYFVLIREKNSSSLFLYNDSFGFACGR